MTDMTLSEAIQEVKQLFNVVTYEELNDEHASYYTLNDDGTARFYLHKREYFRHEVIDKLATFFDDKYITDGQCRISNLTFIWTIVYLERPDEWKSEDIIREQ